MECVVVRSATKQQALAGGKIVKLCLAKQRKAKRAKRALDLAERSEAPNPGNQRSPFSSFAPTPGGRWKKLVESYRLWEASLEGFRMSPFVAQLVV